MCMYMYIMIILRPNNINTQWREGGRERRREGEGDKMINIVCL